MRGVLRGVLRGALQESYPRAAFCERGGTERRFLAHRVTWCVQRHVRSWEWTGGGQRAAKVSRLTQGGHCVPLVNVLDLDWNFRLHGVHNRGALHAARSKAREGRRQD